jgi:16S rRNA C1402 N4-methylase RsmH
VELLKKKIPYKYLNRDLSKVFQALRIEVNNELENLETVLDDSRPAGKGWKNNCCFLSFIRRQNSKNKLRSNQ